MEPALRMMRMNGIMRTAIRLIKGVRIRLERDSFELAVFSVFAWFKVRGMAHQSAPPRCMPAVRKLKLQGPCCACSLDGGHVGCVALLIVRAC